MKVVFIVPFYKRLDLTELCFRELSKQGQPIYAVGSEGEASKALAEKYNVNYIEYPNNPVSNKHNALTKALKTVDFDYAILIGSDDFVNANFTTNYTNYLAKHKPLVTQLDSVYFYNQNNKQLTYFKGFTGVGRAYTKELLELFDYELWHDNKDRGLDTSSLNKMASKGIKPTILNCIDLGLEVLDVKYSDNITDHQIVNLGVKVDNVSIDLKIFDELKNYSNLTIKKTIMKNQANKKTIKIRIIKDVAGLKEGQIRELKPYLAKSLISNGTAVLFDEVEKVEKPKQVRKTRTKKVVKPCEECDDSKPCKGCEESAETTNIPTRKK